MLVLFNSPYKPGNYHENTVDRHFEFHSLKIFMFMYDMSLSGNIDADEYGIQRDEDGKTSLDIVLSRHRPSYADLAARPELTANNNKLDLCDQDQHGEEDNGVGILEMGSIRNCEGQFNSVADTGIMTFFGRDRSATVVTGGPK